MSISVGLSAGKAGFELANGVLTLLQRDQIDVREIQQRLIELQGLILQSQSSLNEAQEDKQKLRTSVEEKDKALKTVDDLDYVADGDYWVRRSDRAKGTEIRYCAACWGDNQKLVPLSKPNPGVFHCVIHKHNHYSAEYGRHQAERQKTVLNARRQPRSGGSQSWMGS